MNDVPANELRAPPRGRLLFQFAVIATLLGACGGQDARAVIERWHCVARSCTVDFVVRNTSGSTQVIKYTLRARGGSGSAQAVVGEKSGQIELQGGEARPVNDTIETKSRPDQVIISLADR